MLNPPRKVNVLNFGNFMWHCTSVYTGDMLLWKAFDQKPSKMRKVPKTKAQAAVQNQNLGDRLRSRGIQQQHLHIVATGVGERLDDPRGQRGGKRRRREKPGSAGRGSSTLA
mmetsp:Transcript_40534/g.117200  ORF Transcript_40534/g.117200 Transcript_40534/m.117200 type:complete len:112 (+) Transcript_40534:1297-1632(+)